MTYTAAVQLSEAEGNFLWESCSPVAAHIPTRCAPPSGLHDEGYYKITAELPRNAVVGAPVGASEAAMAKTHLSPPYTEYLLRSLEEIAADADQVEGSGVVAKMASAVAELIDPLTGKSAPLVYVLGENSYRSYIAEYAEKSFSDPVVNFAPVTFVQNPVYCMPGLLHNIVFAEGSLVLHRGAPILSRHIERDVRVLDQFVRLKVASDQVIGFE